MRGNEILHQLSDAIISVNDTSSIAPYERLVTFNDAQRVLMLALLKQAETAKVMEGVQRTRSAFWDSRLGHITAYAGVIFGLIMAFCALYEVIFGLSGSIVGHH